MKNSHSYLKYSTTLIFGVIVFLFYGLFYSNHLHYQEQYQIFQFSINYFIDTIFVPGGIAIYLSRFLTQFFYYSWAGAFIISCLLSTVQILSYFILKKRNSWSFWYPLTFIPSIAIWGFLCDENGMLAFLIAIIFALTAILLYQRINNIQRQVIYTFCMMLFLFWTIGGAYIVFLLTILILKLLECIQNKRIGKWDWAILAISSLYLINILIAREITFYPAERLIMGIGYYRFNQSPGTILIPVISIIVFTPLLFYFLPDGRNIKSSSIILLLQFCLIAGGGLYWVKKSADFPKEEAMAYDYLVRMKKWPEIIGLAEKHKPSSPIATCCLNLALAKTGQLGDRLFDFKQAGRETLIPTFKRDFTSSLVLGEIYYHSGLVNAAQRLAFEAMEAIPDYQKSTRCFVRLAETRIINGQYDAALPFLLTLTKTLFYRKWALEKLSYLNNEEKINADPEYGWLRKIRCSDDFIFADNAPDGMLFTLMQDNPQNKLAFQYLMAWELLNGNLNRFVECLPLGSQLFIGKMPKSYQEALLFIWGKNYDTFTNFPGEIDMKMKKEMQNFLKESENNDITRLEKEYENTFWYYLKNNDMENK